ncbi:MAG: 50S ribosomal protein L13 [Candidatus Berkelbacteria bacterium]|nr:50S ribosomal protein L13 [Candidatus Berkelbacteria bacterium]
MDTKYYLIDASKLPLGRFSTQAAFLLMGKNDPNYAPNVVANNVVIIINSDKLYLTGTKELSKKYYRHSGYPGGIKERDFADMKKSDSTEIIKMAIRGMIPHNRLETDLLKHLKIFKGSEHTFAKQKIEEVHPVKSGKAGLQDAKFNGVKND